MCQSCSITFVVQKKITAPTITTFIQEIGVFEKAKN